ncbi:MAG: 3-keto-disaccharide hydrolase [Lacipirellulaceae bacterium]
MATVRTRWFSAVLLATAATAPALADEAPLFNGVDLAGWTADVPEADGKPDTAPSFAVRDGMLVSLGKPLGHLVTDAEYGDYRLEVEYRFTGEPGNCGVLVHASKPRVLYGMFPQSLEVQLQSGEAGDFWCIGEDVSVPDMEARRGPRDTWGVLDGKARRIKNLVDGAEKPLGEWNTMVIECRGDELRVWVNDQLANHGSGCTASRGKIALQAEGTEVEFRKLELTPLTDAGE